MKINKKFLAIALILLIVTPIVAQQFARRVLPIFNNPSLPCVESSIYYNMISHRFQICTNNGIENVAVGAVSGIPLANASTTGVLSSSDWLAFSSKQSALGFTPENLANKNSINGYAGLNVGKISLSQISEVLDVLSLSDYSTTSGSGSTAIKSTVSSVASGDVLTWNGSNWINSTITDLQVPDTITVDFANTAGTALTGDSATSFFPAGTVEAARIITGSIINNRCLRIDNSGNITIAADDCGIGGGSGTITLSGNVTGSGTTAITTTIANGVVTNSMLAGSIAASKLIGTDISVIGTITSGIWNGTTIAIANGGTGQTTATNAINALLPTQTGNNGKFLTTNGSVTSWVTVSGTGDMILASVQTVTGAKTFDPGKLIVGSVSTDPAVVIGGFYRDTDDGKLYFGVDDVTDFWGEVFIAGQSLINLASNVTGILPSANGGAGTINGIIKANGSGTTSVAVAGTDYLSPTVFTGIPYDVSTQIDSKPAINLQVLRYVAARSISLSSSGHVCSAITAATAQTDFVVAVNGVSKGTLRFAASGTTCTIVSGSTASIVAGDIVTITAPASQDSTLADVAFTLKASLP